MDKDTVVLEQEFALSVEQLWKAITELNQLRQWYFDLKEFKAEPGYEFSFPGQGQKGEKFVHLCKITEVVYPKKLQYSWQYQNYEAYSLVTFELFSKGKHSILKLTHAGLQSFPQSNPDFAFENFRSGWKEIISKSLTAHVNSNILKL